MTFIVVVYIKISLRIYIRGEKIYLPEGEKNWALSDISWYNASGGERTRKVCTGNSRERVYSDSEANRISSSRSQQSVTSPRSVSQNFVAYSFLYSRDRESFSEQTAKVVYTLQCGLPIVIVASYKST